MSKSQNMIRKTKAKTSCADCNNLKECILYKINNKNKCPIRKCTYPSDNSYHEHNLCKNCIKIYKRSCNICYSEDNTELIHFHAECHLCNSCNSCEHYLCKLCYKFYKEKYLSVFEDDLR